MAESLAPAEQVRRLLLETAEVCRLAAEQCVDALADAAQRCTHSLRAGGKILLCGNGGSAANCQHLAAEFVNVLSPDRPRPALAAIALTTDTSLLTARANDFGFESVFERQVEALGRRGDVLIGITTSGDSANVVRALERARSQGLTTILITGENGGKAAPLADVVIRVPSPDTRHVQEAHVVLGHALCALVENKLAFP